jgi:hypothetical protein
VKPLPVAVFVFLLGCKAESVGVEVPRGGPDAISMADLQRDTFILEAEKSGRTAGTARPSAAWASFGDRLRQMKTVPAYGRSYRDTAGAKVVCGRKDGKSSETVVIAAYDDPSEPGRSTTAMAMVISLAKAWDVRQPPARTLLFCAWEGDAGLAAFSERPPIPAENIVSGVILGGEPPPLAGAELEEVTVDFTGPVARLDFESMQVATVAVEAVVRRSVGD